MPPPKISEQTLPLVVAHRGASSAEPENTLPAFEAAVEADADVVELDVRLTADDVPVVLHDADVATTTEGQGFVHAMTLEEVKRLDASGGRGERAEIPTVREALELLSGRVAVNFEIKNIPGEPSFDSPREAIADRVVGLIEEFGIESSCLVSSFNWLSIEFVRERNARIGTGFLTIGAIDPRASLVYAAGRGHAFVLPQIGAVLEAGAEFVRQAHEQGVRVGTWVADDGSEIERVFSFGVDAVATNRPDVAVPIRDRFRHERAELRPTVRRAGMHPRARENG